MLAANPSTHIRLPSASELDDPLFAVLTEYQAAVSEKLEEYERIMICTFAAYHIIITNYPCSMALGRGGGITALSHRRPHANLQSNR